MRTHQILENSAANWPDHPAIIDDLGVITYRALYQQTRQLSNALQNAGLEKGHGLGVMGRNGRAFVIAMFAGMACGATVIPLSHQLKQAEVQEIIDATGLHAVLDDRAGVTPVAGETLTLSFADISLRFAWTRTASREQAVVDSLDAAFIRYTSGTTGVSKGVVLTYPRLLERIDTAQLALKLSPGDAVLWVLPMAFHFLVTIMVYLRYGVSIVVCKDLFAQTIIGAANKHHATLLYAAPMHYRLLAADPTGQQMATLKHAISTSSAIPAAVADGFSQRFKLPVAQAYGIIEAGLPLLDNNSDSISSATVGLATEKFTVGILGQDYVPVAKGETGRLALKGPGMFNAYLTPWRTSKQVMKNGWFMTGDLAYQRNDAKFFICGREKAMINVSGNKAFPEEIEVLLNSHPDIRECRVFGQDHPLMGEVVCAQVVLNPGIVLDTETILRFCRQRLSTYKVPQRLQQVMHIPRTHSGKIKRATF
jgi:acyl-coenzyme A synthetase/AMP-(fatty) acid ligase